MLVSPGTLAAVDVYVWLSNLFSVQFSSYFTATRVPVRSMARALGGQRRKRGRPPPVQAAAPHARVTHPLHTRCVPAACASAILQASATRIPLNLGFGLLSSLGSALRLARSADGTARLAQHNRPVRPVRAALHVYGVGRTERTVGRKLEGRAVDKGAVGEDNLVRVRGRLGIGLG